MKTGRCVAAAVAMSFATVLQAEPMKWFDAGISAYEDWPTDGSPKVVEGEGVWTNTQYATLNTDEKRLEMQASSAGEGDPTLAFNAAVRHTLSDGAEACLHSELVFSCITELPEIVGDEKGGILVSHYENGLSYFGIAAASEGGTNTWIRLSGVLPDTNNLVQVAISVTNTAVGYAVQYSVGGTPLVAGEESLLPVFLATNIVEGAIFKGNGVIAALSATSGAEPLMASLTIPEIENVVVTSVSVAGVPVALEDGVYRVPEGSVVTVVFSPATGYALSGAEAEQVFTIMEDTTLDAAGLPHATRVAGVVTINEVMASNGTTLQTVNGEAELDWIELKNAGDEDVDLTGWYLFDDPTKKTSKWEKIQGSCIVPAHGFKIVWADKYYDNFAEGESWTRISLSGGGETPFLAGPDGAIAHQIDYPPLPRDYSCGIGRHIGTGEDNRVVVFKTATPGAENTQDGYDTNMTHEVSFSVPHGWKTEAFDLELSCAADPGAEIYYTTNGTSPTTESIRYTTPIRIERTTCIRAAVPRADSYLQLDASATYLFLDDVIRQQSGVVPNGFPASGTVKSQVLDYGLNQAMVDGADHDRMLAGFTNSAAVATISLVVDPANLFDADTGIYVNGLGDGREWERQTMVEQIDPVNGAANEFSIPAGIRIRGASSRGSGYPKHSLRLFFRNDYGKGALKFKLFGDEGAKSFDKVDLRTSQNHAWANNYYYGHSISRGDTFVHEVFSRDAQRDMGEPYTRSRNYHLFINGHYWGMYQTQERGDEDYAEEYIGGDKDNYDVMKSQSADLEGGRQTGPTAGNADAWNAMWDMAINQGFTGSYESNYMKIMGRDPDGSRNAEYPVYLDPTNLITYMLISHYVVDADTPASTWYAALPNNIVAIRDRNDSDKNLTKQGFIYLRHDAEHSMGVNPQKTTSGTLDEVKTDYDTDPTIRGTELWSQAFSGNPSSTAFRSKSCFNPAILNFELAKNTEYKTLLGDLFYKHCLRPGGALTPEESKARFASRTNEIDNAILCEAARWGHRNNTTKAKATREYWMLSCSNVVDFIDHRTPYMVAQYRNRGWYPSIDAPVAVDAADAGTRLADEAVIPEGNKIFIESDNDVYYTTDGSDPRLAGGEVSASATLYDSSAGITPTPGKFILTMRAKSGSGEWSAKDVVPLEGEVLIPTDQKLGVRVFEIYSSTADGGDTGEFITLTNLLDRAVSLDGMRLDAYNAKNNPPKALFSIEFGDSDNIPANGAIKLTREAKWPEKKISNGKVSMTTTDSNGKSIQSIYIDADWWEGACDGTGRWFIAQEFGDSVTEVGQWTPSPAPSKYDAGEVVECDDNDAATAKAAEITANPVEYINVPDGVTDGAAYVSLFKGVAEGVSVSIVLTEAAEESSKTNANEVAEAIPLAAIAASGADGTVTVPRPIPGLWYSVVYGTNLADRIGWEESDRTMATTAHSTAVDDESKLKLSVPRPEGDKCFYEVNINVQTNAVE